MERIIIIFVFCLINTFFIKCYIGVTKKNKTKNKTIKQQQQTKRANKLKQQKTNKASK